LLRHEMDSIPLVLRYLRYGLITTIPFNYTGLVGITFNIVMTKSIKVPKVHRGGTHGSPTG